MRAVLARKANRSDPSDVRFLRCCKGQRELGGMQVGLRKWPSRLALEESARWQGRRLLPFLTTVADPGPSAEPLTTDIVVKFQCGAVWSGLGGHTGLGRW